MAVQDFWRFGNLDIEVGGVMSCTPGETADTGQIVTRATETQPTSMIADLKLMRDTDGTVTTLRTWTNCRLDDPRLVRTEREINFVYQVKDRRWLWEPPFNAFVHGRYNVRDEDGEITEGTAKNARELATLCLDTLGESGYDVSVLPTDADLAPETDWKYESAAIALGNLVRLYGCSIHLLADDTIAIKQDGTGTVPTDTGLMEEPEAGLLIEPVPDYIRCYAGDTLFDSWLTTEPVGMEIDGSIKHIELLSYRPSIGWSKYDPSQDPDMVTIRKELTGMSEEVIERTLDCCRRSVFRMYRVIGLSPGLTKFPSLTENIGYQNTSANYVLVLMGIDSDGIPYYSNEGSEADYGDAMALLRSQAGLNPNDRYVVAPPGTTVFDTRNILPLEAKRVAYGDDKFTGRRERQNAQLCGDFQLWSGIGARTLFKYGYTAINSDTLRPWKFGFSLDVNTGIVTLSANAVRIAIETGETDATFQNVRYPASLYLRTAYRVRLTPFGVPYHRGYRKATGYSLGTPDAVIPREDVRQTVIQQYTNDYQDVGTPSTVTNNATDIDTILENMATEDLKRYANRPAPQKRVYTPSLIVNTDGKVRQITYDCYVGRPAKTTVSIGAEYDRGQAPAFLRERRIREQKKLEEQSKSFVSNNDKETVNAILKSFNPHFPSV